MNEKDLQYFVGKRVLLTVDIYNEDYFYEGFIVSFNEDSLVFKDRYERIVLVRFDKILKVEESRNGRK